MKDKKEKHSSFSSLNGFHRAVPIILVAVALFIGLCFITQDIGAFGQVISSVLKGLFSFGAYTIPFLIAIHALFYPADLNGKRIVSRLIFSILTLLVISAAAYTFTPPEGEAAFTPGLFYTQGVEGVGGGFVGGIIAYGLIKIFGRIGTIIIAAAIIAIYAAYFFSGGKRVIAKILFGILKGIVFVFMMIEKGFKAILAFFSRRREEKAKRETEEKQDELVEDEFFDVDNGLGQLSIPELGISETRTGALDAPTPVEAAPTVSEEEEAVPLIEIAREVNTDYGLDDEEPLSIPVVNLDGEENKSVGIPPVNEGETSADSVFTADFDPYAMSMSEELVYRQSSRSLLDERPTVIEEVPELSEEDIERARRREAFEQQKARLVDSQRRADETPVTTQGEYTGETKKIEISESEPAVVGGIVETASETTFVIEKPEQRIPREPEIEPDITSFTNYTPQSRPHHEAIPVESYCELTAPVITIEPDVAEQPRAEENGSRPYGEEPVTAARPQEQFSPLRKTGDDQNARQATNYSATQGGYPEQDNPQSRQGGGDSYRRAASFAVASMEERTEPVYKPNQTEQAGYKPGQNSYNPQPQGGYNPQQSGYNPQPQGGYNPQQSGYNPQPQGGYNPQQSGYNPQPQGGYNPQQNGYNPQPQGGYNPQQSGYNPQPQGGYTPQQSGYNPQPQSGYNPQQSGYNPQPAEARTEYQPLRDSSYTPTYREEAPKPKTDIETDLVSPGGSALGDSIDDREVCLVSEERAPAEAIGTDFVVNMPAEEDTGRVWVSNSETENPVDDGETVGGGLVFEIDTERGIGMGKIGEPETITVERTQLGEPDGDDEDEEEYVPSPEDISDDEPNTEEIPPEKQNPEVIGMRDMFPALRVNEPEVEEQTTVISEPTYPDEEPQYTSAPVEPCEEEDYDEEEDDYDGIPFDGGRPIEPEKPKKEAPKKAKPNFTKYKAPPLDLLSHGESQDEEEVLRENNARSKIIIDTLASFGVIASIKGYDRGPRITRYEVVPAKGVKVTQITNLFGDIVMNLAVDGIRMEAPIPGKSAIGFEVPNSNPETVRLRDLLETEEFQSSKSDTLACIGKDVGGKPVFGDIAKFPHALVAGATGMGKSVSINSILISILYKAHPSKVKLILIDPKRVEFRVYSGIPHLLIPVVTEAKQAAGALMWAVEEMERRYDVIEKLNIRNIEAYNEKVARDPSVGEPMSKIIIVIDELNDLMMQVRDPVEDLIMRIAQKARAAGIHLIIGTQRPDVKVITGTIKANINTRMSCKVTSVQDSRTILEMAGAEKLLNKGDMLFKPVDKPKPIRVQSAFTTDAEVEAVMEYLKTQAVDGQYDEEVLAEINRAAQKCGNKKNGGAQVDDEGEEDDVGLYNDQKFLDAVEVAIRMGKVSTSLLQRKLSIGYSRAAKYLDSMEAIGVVSEPNGQKPREVRMSMDEWRERLSRVSLDDDY
ncbi:MAG: DNA translocase FtsK 4TM domain-containing protein [Clostridia bacterium]|nr:DNA translocase FtsK 4TM domain-containing protein [Clostridia bacterium]